MFKVKPPEKVGLLFQPVLLDLPGFTIAEGQCSPLRAASIMPDAGSPLAGLACYMWHAHAIDIRYIAIDCQREMVMLRGLDYDGEGF